ncbi:hypothetical protein BofuT4_uP065020.1 [Botrytis cinerea T4]|uniref:Uncharacterized protein n=1 Tax=Botryotinia fuckeliana (strain T4) TaxID=999810 RepID=G2XSM3_BOTF4|nr:hypothetical protein BofuT4_uP065020.1 [Botrytis cinerea T4]
MSTYSVETVRVRSELCSIVAISISISIAIAIAPLAFAFVTPSSPSPPESGSLSCKLNLLNTINQTN